MNISILCILLIIFIVPSTSQTTEPPEPPFDDKAKIFLTFIGSFWLLISLFQAFFLIVIAIMCHEKAKWKLLTEHRDQIRRIHYEYKKKSEEPFVPVGMTRKPANLMRSVEDIDKKDMTMKQIKFIERKQKIVQEWDASSKFKSKGSIQIMTLAVVSNDLMENPSDSMETTIDKVAFDENSFVSLDIGLEVDDVEMTKSKMGGSAGGIGSSSIMTASIRQFEHKEK